ncbi:cysteine desulfurase family protein [Fontibacillus sp. BL9]|uniref:cysteine desulfurase family protein n=1 Tax=Fontibacillus sp. BL9 TaxID=3389971 RepID=UPI003979FF96
MKTLYFDYCASSPLYPQVIRQLEVSAREIYANPSSTHKMGFEVSHLIEDSKNVISELLDIKSTEIIFTSGATESNNLAILGIISALKKKSDQALHIVTSNVEHSSVFNCCKSLESEGVDVTYLPVNSHGIVSISELEKSLRPNTALVSVMHVNNETGSIQPVEEIAGLLKSKFKHIYFHVDGVQGFGKAPLKLNDIDLFTISGHKIGAPKGIGVLIAKEYVTIEPLFYGGNQEYGLRPGTTNVSGVLCITEAIRISITEQQQRREYLQRLHDYVLSKLKLIPELVINTPIAPLAAPHIINFSYMNVPSAILISLLTKKGIIVSSQSACSSQVKISRVLMAITNDEGISSSSIRLSFHETVRFEEIEYLVNSIKEMVDQIKSKKKYSYI